MASRGLLTLSSCTVCARRLPRRCLLISPAFVLSMPRIGFFGARFLAKDCFADDRIDIGFSERDLDRKTIKKLLKILNITQRLLAGCHQEHPAVKTDLLAVLQASEFSTSSWDPGE